MRFKRKIAAMLAVIMAFSALATFNVSAQAPQPLFASAQAVADFINALVPTTYSQGTEGVTGRFESEAVLRTWLNATVTTTLIALQPTWTVFVAHGTTDLQAGQVALPANLAGITGELLDLLNSSIITVGGTPTENAEFNISEGQVTQLVELGNDIEGGGFINRVATATVWRLPAARNGAGDATAGYLNDITLSGAGLNALNGLIAHLNTIGISGPGSTFVEEARIAGDSGLRGTVFAFQLTDVERDQVNRRPVNTTPANLLANPLSRSGADLRLYDWGQWLRQRDSGGAVVGFNPSEAERALPIQVSRAPELVIPMNQLSRGADGGGTVILEITPWNTWNAQAGFHRTIGGVPVLSQYLGTTQGFPAVVPPSALPSAHEAGFFRVDAAGNRLRTDSSADNASVLFYSGMTRGAGVWNELPLQITFLPQNRIEIAFNVTGHDNNTVLRLPLPLAASNNVPTVTLISGLLTQEGQTSPARQLPFVQDGRGVNAAVTTATGRNFLPVQTITITERDRYEIRPNGTFTLTLPWGFRFDRTFAPQFGGLAGHNASQPGDYNGATFTWAPAVATAGTVNRDFITITLPAENVVNANRQHVGVGTMTISNLRIVHANPLAPIMDQNVELTFGNHTTAFFAVNGNATGGALPTGAQINAGMFSEFAVTFDRHWDTNPGTLIGNISTFAAGWLHENPNSPGQVRVPGTNPESFVPAMGTQFNPQRITDRPINASPAHQGHPAADGNVATVILREVVPNSGWLQHGVIFEVQDAEGNTLEDVKIQNVHFEISTNVQNEEPPHRIEGNFLNRVGRTGQPYTNVLPVADQKFGVGDLFFHPEGHAVTVHSTHLSQEQVLAGGILELTAHFSLTADPNFAGEVYIGVGLAAVGGVAGSVAPGTINNERLHVANVRPTINIETVNRVLQIGFQEVRVADVTLTEERIGDFRGNRNITLTIGEFRTGAQVGDMRFVPPGQTALGRSVEMEITGATNPQHRAIARLVPFTVADPHIRIDIVRNTLEQADSVTSLELTGLQIRADRNIPQGQYELVLRGSSVANNEDRHVNHEPHANAHGFLFNLVNWPTGQVIPGIGVPGTGVPGTGSHIPDFYDPATTPGLAEMIPWFVQQGIFNQNVNFLSRNPLYEGHRRYGHRPLMFENFITVGTPGFAANADNRIQIAHTPGGSFTVEGESVSFANAQGTALTSINQPPGRLFVPMRSVIEALGGTIAPFNNEDGVGVAGVTAQIGGTTVEWRIGSTNYVVTGGPRPGTFAMSTGGISVSPFIAVPTNNGNNPANNDTTFLPIRYIADAFGLELLDNVGGYAVINPNAADRAAVAPAAAPAAASNDDEE
jgi:hypothetical protein